MASSILIKFSKSALLGLGLFNATTVPLMPMNTKSELFIEFPFPANLLLQSALSQSHPMA
jgi:hypothetical protein